MQFRSVRRPTTARRALAWTGLAGLIVPVAALATSPAADASSRAASVSVHQSFRVPHSGHFRVRGHGWGHGHGMSQYGAQGAALSGLGARKILRFYYPHTREARSHANVAVWITGDTTRDLQVVAERGLTVKDRGTGTVHRLSKSKVRRWRLTTAHGRAVVQYKRAHRPWHRYWRLRAFRGDGEFDAADGTLTLVTPYGREPLRGSLRSAGHRHTVNVLPIDDYVQGVVPSEMPTSWRAAAVRAQAVAARTYALNQRASNLHSWYQICDTSACQVYRGIAAETAAGNAAVRKTAGRYLSWHGRPAFTQFSSSNGGWTTSGGVPYLPAKADPYDGVGGNPNHSWSTHVSAVTLQRSYPRIGTLRRITVTRRDGNGQWGGRVESVTLTGSRHSQTITGDDFRLVLGLRSTWFVLG